jgi:hypothetical protein
MPHPILRTATAFTLHRRRLDDLLLARRRAAGTDRGEGVLSAAIAVLIFAFLGTMMWFGFKSTFTHAQSRTDDQVTQIGN